MTTQVVASDSPVLAHTVLNPKADRYWMFLHGILGSRSNWRSIARRLLGKLEEQGTGNWGAVLVDLRCHGDSQGFLPPHSIDAAANDVRALIRTLMEHTETPVERLVGHSFGGKVALALLERPPPTLTDCWVIDSQPGAMLERDLDDTTGSVFKMLRALPERHASRQAFVEAVVSHGHEAPLGHWLAMNLAADPREAGSYRFALDLDALEALLMAYRETDVWRVVDGHDRRLTVVAGGRSPVLSAADQARLSSHPNATFQSLAEAGHWVHIDAPDALLALLSGHRR